MSASSIHAWPPETFDAPFLAPIEGLDPVERRPVRRSLGALAAWIVALLLHSLLLLAWRGARITRLDALGADGGAGGVSLSLASGVLGESFASSDASQATDAHQAAGDPASAPDVHASASHDQTGQSGVEVAPTGGGHRAGGLAQGVVAGSEATTGSGYDPGAYASLAPLSFAPPKSEPGLLEQVRRCLKSAPSQAVILTVVLTDDGQFVSAYTANPAALQGDTHGAADATEALLACSPYHGMPTGLSQRLTLVVPPATVAAGPAGPSR